MPHRATVYAQLVESELLWSWAQLQPLQVGGSRLLPPPEVALCAGAHAVCDVQLSQVSRQCFTPLGPLCTMFRSGSIDLQLSQSGHKGCLNWTTDNMFLLLAY